MFYQDRNILAVNFSNKTIPLSARIIGWFIAVQAFVLGSFGFLFLIGFSYFLSLDTRPALFGTILIASEFQFGIYWFCIGFIRGISAYGIIKGYRFGWWCLLIISLNSIFDNLAVLPRYKVTVLVSVGINLGIIIWLLCKIRLYGIWKTTEKVIL